MSKFKAILFSLVIFLFSISFKEFTADIDTVFVNWNTATIQSLRQQFDSKEQLKVIDYYKNRLAAFYSYIDIKNDSELNKNSIRYEFLKLIKDQLISNNTFIIEATTNGETVDICNLAIYFNDSNKADIEIHHYKSQGWQKTKVIKDYQLPIDAILSTQRVKWANGFNYDDVIISHLRKDKVLSSDFFLFNTLSSSAIKKILSMSY